METRKFNDLRDELFMLTGIAVAQFQFLEHVVMACMGFVWPEKSEQMFAEITSTDPLRRGETIGRMLAELRKRIQVPNHFDERLSTFIEGRNRLIHHLFREHARTGEVPPLTEMEETKQFISQLISEAEQLRHIFLGFFSVIGKQMAAREGLSTEHELFTFLAPYERKFDSAYTVESSDDTEQIVGREPR